MDDIQRKLALIEQQLAGRNLHKQIISTCPLVFPVTGLIIGILIQNILIESRVTSDGARFIWLWLILLGLLTVATIFIFVTQQSFSNHHSQLTTHQYATAYLALACFVCLGAVRLLSFHHPKPNDIRNLVADEQKLATIRGLIVTEPYVNKNRNWKFARFKFTDPATSFYIKLNEVDTIHGWAKATGTVRVQVDGLVMDIKAGDYVQAYCRLNRFSPPTNPGQFDVAKYLSRKNVFIAASIKSRDGIKLLESPRGGIFIKVKRKMRQTASQALLGNVSPEEPSRGLLEALLLGYRGNIDSSTYRAFRKTGLLHFISLSGMHLGILVWIIWRLCQAAGLMKPARATICIIAIGIFLLTVPPRAPIQRAAIICLVFCVSVFFRRHSNRLNTLSLAAIILLLIRPTTLFEAGWQLSFSTVLGILFFTSWIGNFLHEKTGNWFWNIASGDVKFLKRRTKRLGKGVITIFSIGLAAWLGGAGIALYHFHTITPLTALWTVLAFPLVLGILTVGFLKIILSFLLPTVALGLGIIVDFLSISMIWIVEHIASWDISEILIGKVPGVVIICYYGFVLFAVFVYFWRPLMKRPLLKKAIYTVIVLAMIAFLVATKWQRTHRDDLVITCLDVGHGQAIFAQLPGKANVLFDAGSLHKSDIGGRIIAPFLDYIGTNKIDAIIISHNDIDHINGIPRIAEHCEVSGIYANTAFFDKADQWGTAKFLNDCLSEIGIKIKRLGEDLNLSGNADIKILWPGEEVCKNEDLGDNDKSLVSLLEFAGTKILLCSDIEKFAQRELLWLHPNLKADIAVVPHHGSVNTLETNFLGKLNAGILICSCSRSQYEKQQVIKAKTSAKSFYTSKHGAVTVCISSNGMIGTKTFVP